MGPKWPLALQNPWWLACADRNLAMVDSYPGFRNEASQNESQNASLGPPTSVSTLVSEAGAMAVKTTNVPIQKFLPAEPDHPSRSRENGAEPFESYARHKDLSSKGSI
jgi:hypothetical protein